jgi:uncharacterized protein
MTNKEIIRKVNEGFAADDADKILSYLADDVRWEMAGTFIHEGKEAFRKEINNEAFAGPPAITVKTEIEEGNYVSVDGEVQCTKINGDIFDAFFVDIYRLEDGKIKEMRSYVVEKNKKAF